MSANSKIEWTDHTFNPWWGCTKVSPACDHCYAERDAKRYGFSETGSHFPIWGQDAQRRFFGDKHWNEPLKWNRMAEQAGERHGVFCASYADVMEDRVELQPHRERLSVLIEATLNLDWMLLTKRPQNFRRLLPKAWLENPRPNVIGMTTVESPNYYWRIDALRDTPLAVRGLSIEPLLGSVPDLDLKGIDWVIVGGESGPGARPLDLRWVRDVIRQCREAGVACFVKQLGPRPIDTDFEGAIKRNPLVNIVAQRAPWVEGFTLVHTPDGRTTKIKYLKLMDKKGGDPEEWPKELRVRDFPEVAHA